jgi:hypothetical protein
MKYFHQLPLSWLTPPLLLLLLLRHEEIHVHVKTWPWWDLMPLRNQTVVPHHHSWMMSTVETLDDDVELG